MMKEEKKSSIDALLAAARTDYGTRLVSKVGEISALAARGDWAEARRAAHKVRGSAATYGFAEVGAAAGQIEELLLSVVGTPDARARALIERLLRNAERMAREAAAGAYEAPP